MTVLEAIQRSTDFLTKKGVESPRLQTELLLAHLLHLDLLHLFLLGHLHPVDLLHDLFPGPREHHAARHLLQRSGPVKRVRNQVFLLREDIRSTQKAPQFGKCLLRE